MTSINRSAVIATRFLVALVYVPILGVLVGPFLVLWGVVSWNKRGSFLILHAFLGVISFTIVPYTTLYYLQSIQPPEVYDHLKLCFAQLELNHIVNFVESYKIKFGEYPESLDQLKAIIPKNSSELQMMVDPKNITSRKSGEKFYYKKISPDHYYLHGVTPDGRSFSPGALIPQCNF